MVDIKDEKLTCLKLPNESVAAHGREYPLMINSMDY